jgi:hypothetical protein
MIERLFPRQVLIFLGIFAGAAFLIGLIGAILRSDSAGDVFLSAFEAAILAFAGGLLARSFISFLLWTGGDNENVAFLIGWVFFIWPGLLDIIPRLRGAGFFTRPAMLLWIAASTGAFTGMMDGMWRIHDWGGAGWIAFPLDTTWGLSATTTGDILHLIDFSWGDHAVGDPRTDAHRYLSGIAVKPGFTFTQGSVMSQAADATPAGTPGATPSGIALFAHESTHNWQNRIFGPVYLWSYVVWMILLLIPGLIFGAVVGDVGGGITSFSYFNNPWETWGYAVQGAGIRQTFASPGIWSDLAVGIISIPFFLLFLAGAIWLVYRTWSRAGAGRGLRGVLAAQSGPAA